MSKEQLEERKQAFLELLDINGHFSAKLQVRVRHADTQEKLDALRDEYFKEPNG